MSTGDREHQRAGSERANADSSTAMTSPAPGKLTRAMPLALEAPAPAFGQSRASTPGSAGDRAEPWLMDDASMSAMGLAPEAADSAEDDPCRHPVAANRRAFAGASASASGGARVSKGVGDVAGDVVDLTTYAAAFTAGILEGAWSAVVDLFQGAADMIELVAKSAYHLVTANPGAIKDMLMTWVAKLKLIWGNRAEIADDFMRKWESDDDWTRGNFQGEVLGWVMMTALLIMATSGAAALTASTGRWASVLLLLHSVDALGGLTSYVAKLGRLPGKAADVLHARFGKGAESAGNGAETATIRERRQLADGAKSSDDGAISRNDADEAQARVGGGKFGVDNDSGLDMLTDPSPTPEVLEARSKLTSSSEYSLKFDAKTLFRELVRKMLARRDIEVSSVLSYLRRSKGTGLEKTSQKDLSEVFDYLFQSNGIELSYTNYAAWRRISTGAGLVDDLRFIRHELEELKQLRAGGLDNPLGNDIPQEKLGKWQEDFFIEHYLPAHQKALDVELEFLSKEIETRTNGELRISSEEIAMSDRLNPEAKIYAFRDGQSIEAHPLAETWNRSGEKVNLSKEVAATLHLPRVVTIGEVIRAVKLSRLEYPQ